MQGKLKSIGSSTNFWIIIGTLTALVLFYIFYLEYHIAKQESQIISTRFRVLDQMGDNIDNKINSYQSSANELGEKILLEAKKKSKDKKSKFYRDYSRYLSNNKKQLKLNEKGIESLIGEFFSNGNKDLVSGYLNKDLDVFGVKFFLGEGRELTFPKHVNVNQYPKPESNIFYYFDPVPIKAELFFSGSDSIFVRTNYTNLIKGQQRSDVFDGFFVLRDKEIVFSTLKSDLIISTSINGEAAPTDAHNSEQIDALLQNDEILIPGKNEAVSGHVYSGEFLDFTISNKNYKLFVKPVRIGGEEWMLCGLMDIHNFNAAKRSISPWVIILLSIILLLIVLGLPLVKLKVMSKTEHLDTSTIINSALSVLLGTAVITLFFLFVSQNSAGLQSTDKRLMGLSGQIYDSLNSEIDQGIKQLHLLDSIRTEFEFDNKTKFPIEPVIPDILNLKSDAPGFLSSYSYADYLFWIDSLGRQLAYLTPMNEIGNLTDLKNRDYFKKYNEWFLPSDSTQKFRLESIISLTSGNHKVALSTNSISRDTVLALSSRFHSIIDPIIPRNYGFCIIDETGKVWFHSNKNRNMMENFISECNDNAYLKSAIYSRTSKPIYANYYNNPHRIFIRPIDNLPLYLLTFYNRKADTSFHAQVFTLTLLMLTGFFLFIFVQVIILLAMERKLQWKLSKNLIMKVTRPKIHHRNHYIFLIFAFLLSGIGTAILLSYMEKLPSLFIIYSLEIILFTFGYRVLNHNKMKIRRRKWFTGINLAILLLIDLGALLLLPPEDRNTILIFQVLLIITLELAYYLLKPGLEKYNISLNSKFIQNYVLFIIAIASVFAIIPTLKLYEIGYNIESEIRLRHNQLDLMKKREKRNTIWNNYYTSQINQSPRTDSILSQRKNHGIYTSFLNGLDFSQEAIKPAHWDQNKSDHSVFDSMVVFLRPFYDDEVVQNKYLAFDDPDKNNKHWIPYPQDSLVLKYISQTEDPNFDKLSYHRIMGQIEILNFLAPFHGPAFTGWKGVFWNLAFWIILFFILFIIYHLIHFGVLNLYSLNIVQNYSHEGFGEIIRHQMLANKDIFIVRLSARDETTTLKDGILKDIYLDWSDKKTIESSVSRIDDGIKNRIRAMQKSTLLDSDDAEQKHPSGDLNKTLTVFIDQFDWQFDAPELFIQKLNILRTLIKRKDIRLIILSQLHPVKIIAFYQSLVEKSAASAEASNDGENQYPLCLKILTEFTQFTTNLIVNYLPVRYHYSWEDEDRACKRSKEKMSFPGLIKSELGASDYLVQYSTALNKFYETYCESRKIENPEELIITKINTLADSYYQDIFDACSDEEKYVLYDLAEDLIMNQKNSKAIFGLLQKGILVKRCDKINLMNVSFRRFLISGSSKANTSALELKIGKESGTWKGYKFTLLLIIAGLFVFIAMANQDFIENLNQLFIVIGGAIAAITGILGLLSRKKNTESS